MDIKPITLGTKSLSIKRVTPELYKAHSGQFLYMMQEYFKSSSDKSSDPISTFNRTKDRLDTDHFMMLAPMLNGIPIGFLAADIVRDAARILLGYVHETVKPQTKNDIISQVMDEFEAWARSKNCRVQIFYTHRAPGAHRIMMKRGWEYDLSIYKKEITYGR